MSALVNGSRGIGDKLAAKLESYYAKPAGWFDLPYDASPVAAATQAEPASQAASVGTGPGSSAGPVEASPGDEATTDDIPLSALPTERNLTRTLWLLASQIAALPEAPRKSVLYFIQEIGKTPTQPHDWIEQAGAIARALRR